jgi:hypothetical protein
MVKGLNGSGARIISSQEVHRRCHLNLESTLSTYIFPTGTAASRIKCVGYSYYPVVSNTLRQLLAHYLYKRLQKARGQAKVHAMQLMELQQELGTERTDVCASLLMHPSRSSSSAVASHGAQT